LPARQVCAGIVCVLRTGIHWNALPNERFGSPRAIPRDFLTWQHAGFFPRLWQAGLMEYDERHGIAWTWQSIDGSLSKAPLAQEAVGPNPTARGKKWAHAPSAGGRAWSPRIARRQRGGDAGCVPASRDLERPDIAASAGVVAVPAISERGYRVSRRTGLEGQSAAGGYARLAATWKSHRTRAVARGSETTMEG